MRTPAQIKPWLTIDEMMVWVREAPTKKSNRHRLPIWLTYIGPFHAQRVAELLAVSVPSVWHWVKEYNNRVKYKVPYRFKFLRTGRKI